MTRHRDDHPDRARLRKRRKKFPEASKGQFDEPAMAKGSKYSAHRFDALRFVTGLWFSKDRREERAELWIEVLLRRLPGLGFP